MFNSSAFIRAQTHLSLQEALGDQYLFDSCVNVAHELDSNLVAVRMSIPQKEMYRPEVLPISRSAAVQHVPNVQVIRSERTFRTFALADIDAFDLSSFGMDSFYQIKQRLGFIDRARNQLKTKFASAHRCLLNLGVAKCISLSGYRIAPEYALAAEVMK